jgi:hypothetical protein
VIVALATGDWRVLAPGSPDLVWHRPRFSPDGAFVAAGYQGNGHWGIALVDVSTGAVRRLPSDGSSRYSPAFLPSGKELIAVSERSGVANLEVFSVDGGPARSLTRVTGAVLGPDVSRSDGSIWYLALRSGGYDVRRLPGNSPPIAGDVVAILGAAFPAAPPIPAIAQLDSTPHTTSAARGYGLGPRRWRVLPGGAVGPDGGTALLMVSNIDPIGRLSVVTQAGLGSRGTWRGASIAAGLRRLSVGIETAAWLIEHEPSRSSDPFSPPTSDLRSRGVGATARIAGEGSRTAYAAKAGLSFGQVSNSLLSSEARWTAWGDARGRLSRGLGPATVSTTAGLSATFGETNREQWQRTIASAALSLGTSRYSVRADWARGHVTAARADEPGRLSEQFVIGGAANPFIDAAYLSQRIPMPAVPAGLSYGRRFQQARLGVGGLDWEPYMLWLAAGDSLSDVRRVVGLERTFTISSLGFARLPAVAARGGVSYSFDEPFQYRTRLYASVRYAP